MKKSKKLFSWQYQPRIPYNENYYDLDKQFMETMQWQIDSARKNGLYGFCFYHYWFKDGKKLMEKPIERFLQEKDLNMPFCLSWANEPWTRAWDGGEKEVIMPQEYGNKAEWKRHFDYLNGFFEDDRYIKIDNKPMILIYRPELIADLDEMLSLWTKMSMKSGFDGLYIVSQGTIYGTSKNRSKYVNDYILYEPGYTQAEFSLTRGNVVKKLFVDPVLFCHITWQKIKRQIGTCIHSKSVLLNTTVLNYDLFWKRIIRRKYSTNMIPGAFVDWDNSPRRGLKGARVFKGANPDKFRKYMRALIKKTKSETTKDMIFIDAWNEWCEGAYLEPDSRYGNKYLSAIRDAKGNYDK